MNQRTHSVLLRVPGRRQDIIRIGIVAGNDNGAASEVVLTGEVEKGMRWCLRSNRTETPSIDAQLELLSSSDLTACGRPETTTDLAVDSLLADLQRSDPDHHRV